jgi:hypothetical protein
MRRTFQRSDLARRESVKGLVRCAAAFVRGPRYGAAFTALTIRGLTDGWRGRQGRVIETHSKESA